MRHTCMLTYYYVLTCMLSLELPQAMLRHPGEKLQVCIGVRAGIFFPAHVDPLRLFSHPRILFPHARRYSLEFKPIQARVVIV